ncbi:MAG: hypothetical protein KGM15_11520 [Pseudomonadota bacterium]|nr:hypothetical protein [Pseudomonadota bacterium]
MSISAPALCPDAAELRRSIYEKGAATRTNLAALMALGRQFGDDPAFIALVADVARDAMALDVDPRGYVCEADADWLIARLGDGGGLTCRAEFEALKAVIGHAASVPPALVAFAVREVERAILTGRRGPIGGVEHEPGVVTAQDVAALRIFCFAPIAGAACHVDRATAEALFDIAHATATGANDPGFADLFAKAVGNYLLGAVFVEAPSRSEAIEIERDMDRRQSFGEFLSGLAGGLLAGDAADGRKSVDQLAEERYREENDAAQSRLDAAAGVDAGEAKWILAHLTRGGELSAAEKRLIAFLRDESTSTPPEIAALFDRAA